MIGWEDGLRIGCLDGNADCRISGCEEGFRDGVHDGLLVGNLPGCLVGNEKGCAVGPPFG